MLHVYITITEESNLTTHVSDSRRHIGWSGRTCTRNLSHSPLGPDLVHRRQVHPKCYIAVVRTCKCTFPLLAMEVNRGFQNNPNNKVMPSVY